MSWTRAWWGGVVLTLTGCLAPAAPPAGPLPAWRAAGQGSPPAWTELGPLYPLKVGARWSYRLLQRQGEAPAREASMLVAISELRAGPEGVEARLDRRFGQFRAPSTRVSLGPHGLRLARWVEADPAASLVVLQPPLTPGQSWPGRPLPPGFEERVVAEGTERVEVPAGSFWARRVRHDLTHPGGLVLHLHYWYAPGVGVVRMIERALLQAGPPPLVVEAEGLLTGASGLPEGPQAPAGGSVGTAPEPWTPGPPQGGGPAEGLGTMGLGALP